MASYKQRYTELNRNVPVGSRSLAGVFSGSQCPENISLGRGHGTSPMIGTVQFSREMAATYGKKVTLRIGATTFVGIIVYVHNNRNLEEGVSTEIKLVDGRDRLHDVHVYGQFNMIDTSNGMYYHLLPVNYLSQIRTIVRKLEPQEFYKLEEKPKVDFTCQFGLISAATLFNELAKSFSFTWTASKIALRIMKYSRPENIDWNSGVKVIDAMQAVIEKSGLQMTFWGDLHCHITLKGWSDNPMMKKMMSANTCTVRGFVGDSRGGELNDRGRRVVIIGDRNKYENFYPATPNWNKKFTLGVCLGWEQAVLLEKHNLTLRSKLSELPVEWHDTEKWNGKPRTEMTIEEYINEICFKVYVVDVAYPIKDLYVLYDELLAELEEDDDESEEDNDEEENKVEYIPFLTLPGMREETTVKGKKTKRRQVDYKGGEDYKNKINDNDPFNFDYNSYFPVADSLVTDSQRQFVAYTSYKQIRLKGYREPWDFDPTTISPVIDGVSLDVESVVDEVTCCERFRVRVIFSEMKFILAIDSDDPAIGDNLAEIKATIDYYGPDYIAVQLAIEKEIYTYEAGEEDRTKPRLREQKRNVGGLRKNFINDEEVSLLSVFVQTQNVEQFVKADQIAERIAQQVLFHEFIIASGDMALDQESGFQCDGLIDTISITFDTEHGLEERLTFTSLVNDFAEPFIVGLTLDSKTKDTKEIVADLLNKKRIEVAKAHKAAKQIAGNKDVMAGKIAGQRSWQSRANVFGDDEAVGVRMTAANAEEQKEFYDGEGLLVANAMQEGDEFWKDTSKDGNVAEDLQIKFPDHHLQKFA